LKFGITLHNSANVPTTVFTPVEYGACGMSEEDAIAKVRATLFNCQRF